MSDVADHVADHFESLEQQAHAARLGMWVFLASEVLLFGAAITLFIAYQVEYPHAFHEGIAHNTKLLGTINTGVLLTSSTLVALAVHLLREGSRRAASALVGGTIFLALVFLAIKIYEYSRHFEEGIYPGGSGKFFLEHRAPGMPQYWTLYYGMTGIHAIHVTIGAGVLAVLLFGMLRGHLNVTNAHRLEIGAIYWHLVDIIWIFLWPMFYLA